MTMRSTEFNNASELPKTKIIKSKPLSTTEATKMLAEFIKSQQLEETVRQQLASLSKALQNELPKTHKKKQDKEENI